MGDITTAAFGVLTLVGLALVALGAIRRARVPLVLGAALLLAVAGAWVFGVFGVLVVVLPFGFLRRRRN